MLGTSFDEVNFTSTIGCWIPTTFPGSSDNRSVFDIKHPRGIEFSHIRVNNFVAPAKILSQKLLIHFLNFLAAFLQMNKTSRLLSQAAHAKYFIESFSQ